MDFKVLTKAHVSPTMNLGFLTEAHLSYHIEFKVFSDAPGNARRYSYSIDVGSREPRD